MLNNLKTGLLGDVASGIGQVGKDIGKELVQTPKNVTKAAGQQIANPLETLEEKEKKKQKEKPKESFASDSDRSEWLRQLYGPSEKKEPLDNVQGKSTVQPQNILEEAQIVQIKDPNSGKTPEEIQKMVSLKQQLHQQQYFNPTFNKPTKQSETEEREKEQQEKYETEQQRMQRLSQEDMQKKQKEQEKKKPIAVQREQNKAEMFRGAAG